MQMEAGLDTGPVLLSQPLDIGADETGDQLHDRLAALGAPVLSDGLGMLRAGMRLVPKPQPADCVIYAHMTIKVEANPPCSHPAVVLVNQEPAFNPYPIGEAPVAEVLREN